MFLFLTNCTSPLCNDNKDNDYNKTTAATTSMAHSLQEWVLWREKEASCPDKMSYGVGGSGCGGVAVVVGSVGIGGGVGSVGSGGGV